MQRKKSNNNNKFNLEIQSLSRINLYPVCLPSSKTSPQACVFHSVGHLCYFYRFDLSAFSSIRLQGIRNNVELERNS